MVEATLQQAAERRAPAMCPMASMCSRMMAHFMGADHAADRQGNRECRST